MIDASTICEVLAMYGLSLMPGGTQEPCPSGSGNNVLAVQTTAGRIILRCSHNLRTQQWLEMESAVLQHLAIVGFPAVCQRFTIDHRSFVRHAGRFWAAFDYIDGRLAVPPDEAELVAMAHMQARLHKVLATFPDAARYAAFAAGFRPRKTWAYMVPLLATLEFLDMAQAKGDLKHLASHPLASSIQEYLRTCRQRVTRIIHSLPSLPCILTHYDYGQFNVLFRQDGQPVVIDFDMLSWEPAVANLARAINVAARLAWMGPFLPARMATYVDAYQAERPLGANELAALPGLLRLFVLQYVIFHSILCIQEPDVPSQQNGIQAMQDDLRCDEELANLTGSEL